MDLLDRLLGHDAWTTERLLLRARELSDDALDRGFDLGHRTVRATFEHVIRNTELWSALMAGQPPDAAPPGSRPSVGELIDRHRAASARLAEVARAVAARDGWDERWLDTLDDPPTRKTYGGAIAHVLTHAMHHRAQLLFMLRRLGLTDLPEGDALSWEAQHAD